MVGTGYVGLVTGACFAEVGNDVLCLDLDEKKIRVLEGGGIPIYEPGLAEVVKRNVAAGRLQFTTDVARAVQFGTVQCIAVGTPPGEDGSADLQHVLAAARNVGRHMTEYRVVVDKSTVPVGTADKVRGAIADELAKRGAKVSFAVVSNPEFLKEGAAVEDFMRPDRVVVGSDDAQATQIMRALYAPFQRNHERLFVMDVRSAELTKYAANAMLATRISFMNELANLAEKLGADIEEVRKGIGSDPRIGYQFLYAGIGYGGSCFPKDVKALHPHRRRSRGRAPAPRRRGAGERRAEARAREEDPEALRQAQRKADRRVGPGVQAQHRRHARGPEPRPHRGAARRRRDGERLRPDRDDRGEEGVCGPEGRHLRRLAARCARRRGRARRGHRVEGVPQSRLPGDQGAAQDPRRYSTGATSTIPRT